MIVANFSEFRTGLKKYLDEVELNDELLLIKRGVGKGAVMLSLKEYNSIMETLHLLKSQKNTNRLFESIEQINSGQVKKHKFES